MCRCYIADMWRTASAARVVRNARRSLVSPTCMLSPRLFEVCRGSSMVHTMENARRACWALPRVRCKLRLMKHVVLSCSEEPLSRLGPLVKLSNVWRTVSVSLAGASNLPWMSRANALPRIVFLACVLGLPRSKKRVLCAYRRELQRIDTAGRQPSTLPK